MLKIVTRAKSLHILFISLYFGYARSQFLDQGLNPGCNSENLETLINARPPGNSHIFAKTLKKDMRNYNYTHI